MVHMERRGAPRASIRFVVLLITLLVAAACQTPSGQEAVTIVHQGGSQANGAATLTNGPGTNQFTVTVSMTGLPPGSHPEHIHTGVCPNPGAIQFPLTTLQASADGRAAAKTTINARLATVADGQHSINVHQPNLTPIACGTIPKG